MPHPMLPDAWHAIAKGLLDQPTAPLLERLPAEFVRRFVAERPALKLSEDAAGNLVVKYSAPGAAHPPLVMVAHLDHPGFHVSRVFADQADLTFHGGVGGVHAQPGTPIHFFAVGEQEPIGAGHLLNCNDPKGRLADAQARIDSGRAVEGGFAMWGFPGFAIEGERIAARCCDDLLGAAASLCALDEIARRAPAGVEVWGLFTRAEEIGFLGTLEAIRLKTVPPDANVISLECSKAFAHAPQGEGVIVRVGDRSSIFDPGLTDALRAAAEGVKAVDASFKYQRKLMDGGSCEATPFCAHGYRASGLALPLGNYHNQAESAAGERSIGPETVHIGDFIHEVQLLVELATRPELLAASQKAPTWLAELETKARETLGAKG